ncbi:MAG: deoxyribodipyrimidine photolyase [Ignavibacteria bacterium]|nr:deoxyribodipyrimidine photolyase [Ignavibacteria bacterium]
MNEIFATDYETILQKIDLVDPVKYGKSRNYIDGAVTYLSPYISRGVISTKQVLNIILEKGYKIQQIESFVKELCWRDYFQRVGQFKDLNKDIRQRQELVSNYEIPVHILNATTGIQGIDNAIKQLYRTGYMHNHCRMYTASLVCNIAKSHWQHPSQWMYYHLLDGDWASNTCSWQWVAGANSNKKYYANQENINKFTFTNQTNTYLDKSYEEMETMETPAPLLLTQKFVPEIYLPAASTIEIDAALPTFIYNYYNLDPLWHKDEPGNRILLIEPEFFSQYPVSRMCVDFMLALCKNISGMQVFAGSFQSFTDTYAGDNVYYKEHPLNMGYKGTEEPRDWITNNVAEYYSSFFGYWKRVEKQLYKLS